MSSGVGPWRLGLGPTSLRYPVALAAPRNFVSSGARAVCRGRRAARAPAAGTIVVPRTRTDSTFLRGEGRTIRITVWLATRDRPTWVAAGEVLAVALIILFASHMAVARLLALAILGHLGYSAMTSLPLGEIPGRPPGAAERRNLDLRSRVVGFLNEVRRAEAYAERARVSGLPQTEIERNLHSAQRRMMAAAAEVVKVSGRPGSPPPGTTLRA